LSLRRFVQVLQQEAIPHIHLPSHLRSSPCFLLVFALLFPFFFLSAVEIVNKKSSRQVRKKREREFLRSKKFNSLSNSS
jgi:hypothetical protein